MRLLFLNHNVAWSGGTFFRAFQLARVLVRQGHEVTLLSISARRRWKADCLIRDGVLVVETPDLLQGSARSGWDPWDTLHRCRWLASRNFDLVHAFDSRPAVVLPALAVARRGVPLFMDWADWWGRGGTIEERAAGAGVKAVVRPIETFFEEHYRVRADGTTVISAALAERAAGLGVDRQTILRLPGGSDVDAVRPMNKTASRRRVGVGDGTLLLGHLGTLLRTDAHLLFGSFRRMRHTALDARLVLIGNTKAEVPTEKDIIRTGFVSDEDKLSWLAACDVLLLPQSDTLANRARWPSKINDYLAAGRPVVATAVGDVETWFTRADIGMVASADPGAFARAVLELARDEARRRGCGEAARRLAETELSWESIAGRLRGFYNRVLADKGRT